MQRRSLFHRTRRIERVRHNSGRPVPTIYEQGKYRIDPPPEALRDDGSLDGVPLRTIEQAEAGS